MMATTLTEVLNINCHPAMAFDLMADVRHITEWNAGASHCEMLTDEPIGAGTRFVTVNRGQEMSSKITTYDRAQHLEFAVESKAMDVQATFLFSEAGSGTQLDIQFEPRPKGIMKVLFPLLRPLIRRDLIKQHIKFKTYCETRGSLPSSGVNDFGQQLSTTH